MASNSDIIFEVLYKKIGNTYGVAGLMGNLYAESGLVFNKLENLCRKRLKEIKKIHYTDEEYTDCVDSGKISRAEFLNPLPRKQYGYGLVQWTTPNRKAGLYDLAKKRGVSIADPKLQLDFLIYELEKKYPSVYRGLISATSVRAASDKVLIDFEAPASKYNNGTQLLRASYGNTYYNKYKNHVIKNTNKYQIGWNKSTDGKWWYAKTTDSYAIGWEYIDKIWYYFKEDGYMIKSEWIEDKGKFYYLSESGALARGAYVKSKDKDLYYWVNGNGEWEPQYDTATPELPRYELVK